MEISLKYRIDSFVFSLTFQGTLKFANKIKSCLKAVSPNPSLLLYTCLCLFFFFFYLCINDQTQFLSNHIPDFLSFFKFVPQAHEKFLSMPTERDQLGVSQLIFMGMFGCCLAYTHHFSWLS